MRPAFVDAATVEFAVALGHIDCDAKRGRSLRLQLNFDVGEQRFQCPPIERFGQHPDTTRNAVHVRRWYGRADDDNCRRPAVTYVFRECQTVIASSAALAPTVEKPASSKAVIKSKRMRYSSSTIKIFAFGTVIGTFKL